MPKNSVGESFTITLISGTEKNWRGGGEYQDFPSKIFCLTVPKISVWEILYCCINFGYRKSLDGRGGVSRFSVENFLSYSAENLPTESFTVALFSGTEKVWIRERGGVIKFFRRKIFVSQRRKVRRGILYCCINFGYRKSLDGRGGGESIKIFRRKFFV